MLEKIILPSFPTNISDEIELPNIGELLNMPFTHLCYIDDFYKNGTEFQRFLVDKLNLLGKTSEIGVTFHVQYLYEGTAPLPDRWGIVKEWHTDFNIDQTVEESPYRSHLLLSDCECLTEFNDREFVVDRVANNITGNYELSHYFEKNLHLLQPRKMTPNRIHTFDIHPHRIVLPTKPQLRFMFRVVENDGAPINKWEEARVNQGRVGKGTEYLATVEKQRGKIILNHSL